MSDQELGLDPLTKYQRSERMGRVRPKDTKPEVFVRKLLFSLGYRYRLHAVGLPGKPDIVFSKKKKVIFVHGCFWHRHSCRNGKRIPKSRVSFWKAKFERNKARDEEVRRKLELMGWQVLVVWECQLKDKSSLERVVVDFLEGK